MKLIVFTRYGHSRHVNLGHPMVWSGFVSLSVLFLAGVFSAGYITAAHMASVREAADPVRVELKAQAAEIARTKQAAQADVDALSGKVAELQAHIMRLDAMGAQLTTLAGLKRGEFNFDAPPPEGGPENPGPVQHTA